MKNAVSGRVKSRHHATLDHTRGTHHRTASSIRHAPRVANMDATGASPTARCVDSEVSICTLGGGRRTIVFIVMSGDSNSRRRIWLQSKLVLGFNDVHGCM
jgi:hypothetical protein